MRRRKVKAFWEMLRIASHSQQSLPAKETDGKKWKQINKNAVREVKTSMEGFEEAH